MQSLEQQGTAIPSQYGKTRTNDLSGLVPERSFRHPKKGGKGFNYPLFLSYILSSGLEWKRLQLFY